VRFYSPRETRRRELIDTVGKTVKTIVDSYDHNKEASELAASVEGAVAQTALLEAGAVGLGAVVTIAVLSSAWISPAFWLPALWLSWAFS